MMEVEPTWFIKSTGLTGLKNQPWHTVYHHCDGADHVCFVPSEPRYAPYCFICKLLVPSRVLGFLILCRWNIEGE